MNRTTGSAGWIDGSGCSFSTWSIIGVESWMPVPSGEITSGMIGILACFSNSAWLAALRKTQLCGIPL